MDQTINLKFFKLKAIFVLLAILVLGSALRIYDINNNPRAMYGDELTMVYDTFSIYKTGMDQLGNLHPLTFQMGAGRPGGYVYFSVPFVALFGPSALGVRGLSILSGILIILLMFYLGKEMFSVEVGLMSAFFLAISPWDISLSRAGFEAHFALFLSLLGVLCFLWANKKPWLYLMVALLFSLAINTYPTFKLTLPLFLLLIVWFKGGVKILFTKGARVYASLSILILVLGGVLVLYQTFFAASEKRFSDLNLFGQDDLQQRITQNLNFERNLEDGSIFSILFHNKYLENGLIFGESYLKNLTADFLFLHGDRDPVHNMANMGEFYWVQLPLMFLGIFWLIGRRDKRSLLFLSVWILIVPIATAFLLDVHALRDDFMLPPMTILSALGTMFLFENISGLATRRVAQLLGILLLIQFIFFIERTYVLSPDQFGSFWALPAKQVSLLANSEKNNFDYVIISSQIDNVEFAYPTYNMIDPKLVIDQNKQPAKLGGYSFKKFDNVYIGTVPNSAIGSFINGLNGKVLFIASPYQQNSLQNYRIVSEKDLTTGYLVVQKP